MNSSKVRIESLKELNPITQTQDKVFQYYDKDYNLCLNGSAGTGKTYIALYLALQDVLDKNTDYDKVVIVRSAVPSRDIGHLPGDEKEKTEVYSLPYQSMCQDFFPKKPTPYKRLLEQKHLDFMCTSFVRGITLDHAIVIVDECQNMNDMEINSIMTRLGNTSKIIFCGDFRQTDLYKRGDMSGLKKFMVIAENMQSFRTVEFVPEDIVRSSIVREYIEARMDFEDKFENS